MSRPNFFFSAAVFAFLGFSIGAQTVGLPPLEAAAKDRLNGSPRHGEWARYPAGGGDAVDAWVVYPERMDRAPVVIVVHEIYGLSDWVRSVADQFAAEGFIAIAPDFLSGKAAGGKGSVGMERDQATALIRGLDPGEIVRRLNATADYAKAIPASSGKYGIVGYCWGGGISFAYATQQPSLGASVVFYGTSPPAETLSTVKAPVLGLYGGNDARVNATIAPAETEMKRLGKRYEYEIFPGAGHGFLRQQDGQNGANLEATKKAWDRTVRFFKGALESGTRASAQAPAVLAAFSSADDCIEYCETEENSAAATTALASFSH